MMDQAEGLRIHFRHRIAEVPPATPAPRVTVSAKKCSGRSRVLAISSGKGGVGKSNLSVNLAVVFTQRGHRTYLLDADLGLGNVEILLGLSPGYDLSHVILGQRTLREIVVSGPQGLQIVPGGSGWRELAQLSSARLQRLLEDLYSLDENADFILIDTGAGIGDNVIQFALVAHEVVLVTTPEPTALADAYGLSKVVMAENPQARLRLVVNLVAGESEALAIHRRLNQVMQRFLKREIEMLGWIPRDGAVTAAVSRQEPFVLAYPRSPATRAVHRIADSLLGSSTAAPRQGVGDVVKRMISFLRRN